MKIGVIFDKAVSFGTLVVSALALPGVFEKVFAPGSANPLLSIPSKMLSWLDGDALIAAGHPILAKACVFGWGFLVALYAGRKAELFWAKAGPSLAVLAPFPNDEVPWKALVRGTRAGRNQFVQLLVKGSDGKWWVQDQPKFDALYWEINAWFGSETGIAGEAFEIVAVECARIEQKWLDKPPKGKPTSQIVRVYRRSNA